MWGLLVQSLAMSVLTAPAPAPCAPYLSAPATPLHHTTLNVYDEGEYVRDVTVLLQWYKYARDKRASAAEVEAAAELPDPVLIHKTEYRAWKRNSDLINSLLSLPKGLIHSGRK